MSDIPLPQSFYQRDTCIVAHDLLGKKIIHSVDGIRVSGIIVETESYGAHNDPASHAFRKQTPRNSPMFGPVGYSYVYFIYGNHFCFNITAKNDALPAGAVLIRAIIPHEGIEHMRQRRAISKDALLTNGPGKLTQALAITSAQSNRPVTDADILCVTEGIAIDPTAIIQTPRIGINAGKELLWRFYVSLK